MNRKIWKALGIAVCMLALAAPRAMAETHRVGSEKQFKDAVEAINKPGDAKNEIILTQDITLGGDPTQYTLYTLSRGETTIKGGGNKITISNAGITVAKKGTVLNLGEKGYKGTLTIDGKTSGGFVSVLEGATANMYEHVTLQDLDRQSTVNACVKLEGNSVFNMHGGVIQNCKSQYSGGLYADNSTLTIKGGTISECSAGTGGGLYAINQSTLNISGGTIENNRAAYGGGVALIGSTINPITHWTVDGNKADNTGGGIYLENVLMDVSDGSNHIYNNTADGHGADIFLYNGSSAIRLPNAADMNVPYHNSGINIDGWYKDDNPRYKPSEDGKAVDAGVELNGGTPDGRGLSLVASYKTKCTVTIDANGGVGGSGSQTVHKGTNVILEAPTKEGHLFKGWKDEKGNSYPAGEDGKVNITVTGDMTLTAVWEARTFTVTYVLLDGKTRTETAAYGKTVTLGEEPRTGYTFVGWKDGEKVYHAGETITVTGDMTLTAEWKKLPSAENLPKTGDESPVLLWGAALAVSAAACFMLRRKK